MMACVTCNVPLPPANPMLSLAVYGAKVTVPVVWMGVLAKLIVSAVNVILPVSDAPPIWSLPLLALETMPMLPLPPIPTSAMLPLPVV
jgi:hypothetical protein